MKFRPMLESLGERIVPDGDGSMPPAPQPPDWQKEQYEAALDEMEHEYADIEGVWTNLDESVTKLGDLAIERDIIIEQIAIENSKPVPNQQVLNELDEKLHNKNQQLHARYNIIGNQYRQYLEEYQEYLNEWQEAHYLYQDGYAEYDVEWSNNVSELPSQEARRTIELPWTPTA